METVYAIHNYCAQNDDELTFKVGDPILVLEKDEMYWDGWWQGQDILGQVGLFPMNYTTELMKNNGSELTTIPEAKMPKPSANETIADIQNKLHQLVAKKHQSNEKINSEPKSDASVCKTNSVPNLAIRTSSITQLQKPSQRQSKGSLKNGRSSVSSSGSNHSEYLSSPSRHNNGNMKTLDYPSKTNNLQGNPLAWNVEQVCQWLKEKGFDSVIEHFIENDITGDILLGLDLDSLKELNIMSYGKRVHIMNAINALKESSILNKDSDSLQLRPIMESTSIRQSNSVNISNKVDARPESSFVKSNEHTSWPRRINNTNEKIQEDDYEKKHKNKSKSLSKKISIEHLDRNSLVGSQLGNGDKHIQPSRLHAVDESIGEDEEALKNNIGTPDYEGWLMKQDDKSKSWKNRFCVLKGQTLYYFQNDKITQTPRAKGSINITGYRIIPDENILQGKYGFKLVHDIERPHYFAHENLVKMREWMKAIMKATISRDPKCNNSYITNFIVIIKHPRLENLYQQKKSLQSSNGSDSPTLERSLSPTLYSNSNSFNRPNPQHTSPRCRSVSPLPEMSGQPTTMALSKSKSSTFKKLLKSTSFDSIKI
ncbi:3324_t:CDS:10 [Dentiscutata heterogama]|uniref:3324_t:CDS:1 n=1 Tax=Dentiscutata heterogama TaxID=1316150 RepID=A0ACA9K3G7_9GLOM|nr:3324_t:CDS:10 [Dentiscutata heterogama]